MDDHATSDIPPPTKSEWLEEPTKPKQSDFKSIENFEFAQEEYKHKLEIYQARLKLHKACEKLTEEQKKDVFRYFQKKHFPNIDSFCPLQDNGKKEPFKTARVAEWIFGNYSFKTDIETGILYFYNGKCWTRNAEPYLKKIISLILRDENRTSYETNIIQSFIPLTYCKIEFSRKLAMENCLFDVETLETSDFNEEEMPFHEIPVFYNKDVSKDKLANWLGFLNQVADPDDIPLLQEWFGYCLLTDYRFHKALWIHGEGRNGKGVFDRTIKGLLGTDNYSTVGLERLDGTQRFILKDL